MELELIIRYLFYAFVGFSAFQIFYFLFFYLRLFTKKNKTVISDKPEVSVVIAARNEQICLEKNLSSFLEQDYPNYKVIVVNDASTDDSELVLSNFMQKYPHLYVTRIPKDIKFKHGKKTALTVGIKAAQSDILLFSDADCKPVNNKWISEIVKNFDEKTDFVIGYGAYETKKGFLNKIVRSDTVLIAMQYLSFAMAGIPYMAVGRNMAYRKNLFNEKKGFADQMNLLSGSDDLFVNRHSNKKNLKTEISKESFTVSEAPNTFKEWRYQKIRHLTTGRYYKFKHKLLIAFEPLTRVLMIVTGVFLLFFNPYLIIVSSILGFRYILSTIFLYLANRKFSEKRLLFAEIIYEFLQPLINFLFLMFANKKKELLWK